MKDFHVGIVNKDDQTAQLNLSDDDSSVTVEEDPKPEGSRNKRFKNIAKKVALRTPKNRWKQTIDDVHKLNSKYYIFFFFLRPNDTNMYFEC